ncbi:MAG: bifunctional diguanylate cyclase/phosphodiesterase [Legionella sp.]|nr:MAG: bifunctional diguanylate cyclase/phosphodiesterase [Legionella sp.]
MLGSLTLFTMQNETLILVLGITYIAISSGGSMFHCYTKYTHIAQLMALFIPYSILCFYHGGSMVIIGIGALAYLLISIYTSSLLHSYLRRSSELSLIKNKRLSKIVQFKEVLNRKQNDLHIQVIKQKQLESELIHLYDNLEANNKIVLAKKQETLAILDLIYNTINEVVVKTNEQGKLVKVNNNFYQTFEIHTNEQLEHFVKQFHSLIPKNHPLHRYFPYTAYSAKTDFFLDTANGKHYDIHLKILNNKENLWIISDKTREMLESDQSNYFLNYDELTHLPNRHHFYTILREAIEESKRANSLLAIVFIDIDQFKLINDSLGHEYGNDLLKHFAKLLTSSIRKQDYLARLGGDEFICLIKGLTYKTDVEPLIESIKAAFSQDIILGTYHIKVNASLGVSFYPCDSEKESELISFADIAMYQAKQYTLEPFKRYNPSMLLDAHKIHSLGEEFKNAFNHDLLYLTYQPIFSLKTKKIEKVEVLLRWREGVNPAVFIPLADQLGLINQINLWVLDKACKARIELNKVIKKPIKFCINLNVKEIETDQSKINFINLLSYTGCKGSWLEFELSEQSLVDVENSSILISTAQQQGIAISIDNFGNGISSLSLLKSIQFHTLKLDRQFIQHSSSEEKELNLLHSLINLARQLQSEICITGIETSEQYQLAIQESCHYLQGFYLSKPLDFATLVERLQKETVNKKPDFMQ